MRRSAPVATALAMFLTAAMPAAAVDHPLAGEMLRLGPASRVRVRADGASVADRAAGADPRVTGAVLELAGSAIDGAGMLPPVPLPAPYWRGIGDPAGSRGFRYVDRPATFGVRKAVLRLGRRTTLVVAGGGTAWPYRSAGPAGTVAVDLRAGDDVYCTRFDGLTRGRRGATAAGENPAPAACQVTTAPECGNGAIESPEECDDGGTASGDGCDASCRLESAFCGNDVVDPGEECDDGGRQEDDGCSPTCTLEDASGLCAGVPSTPGMALATTLVASGFASPIHLTAPPLDPSRLFVVEQGGLVRVVRDGVALPDPFLDASDLISCCGERGLLSLAFHPDYEHNRRFFVAYTDPLGDVTVARYEASADPDVADPATFRPLLAVEHRDYGNHNGGQLAFGPDGYLYLSIGDGGAGDDVLEAAQDLTRGLGKILRLDVDVDAPPWYAIPPSNPFAGPGAPLDEIWALGLRNPWRMSFDRETGDLYIGDVGQGAFEEIDVQPAASAGGENYGWDVFEGSACHEPEPPALTCPQPPLGFTFPVVEYDHSAGCSVTGGHVYRGCALPDLRGTYFYSDFCTAFIRTFRGVEGGHARDEADRTAELAPGDGRAIEGVSSFGEDARGEIYIVDYDGEIYRIVARTP